MKKLILLTASLAFGFHTGNVANALVRLQYVKASTPNGAVAGQRNYKVGYDAVKASSATECAKEIEWARWYADDMILEFAIFGTTVSASEQSILAGVAVSTTIGGN